MAGRGTGSSVAAPAFLTQETNSPRKGDSMFDGNCLIRRASVTPDGRAQFDLKAADGSWDWNWFLGQPALTREGLAVALAAITSDKQVAVQIENPAVARSLVLGIFLVK